LVSTVERVSGAALLLCFVSAVLLPAVNLNGVRRVLFDGRGIKTAVAFLCAVKAVAATCSWFTATHHPKALDWASGKNYQATHQLARHGVVIHAYGKDRDQRHYRVLPAYLLKGVFQLDQTGDSAVARCVGPFGYAMP
jgi:hypothetical protein